MTHKEEEATDGMVTDLDVLLTSYYHPSLKSDPIPSRSTENAEI